MSVVVTNLCRRLQVTPAQKCVLMALADRADENGVGWPSIPWLCEWTCFGRTAVIEALKWLEAEGLLQISKVSGRNNLCAIDLERMRARCPRDEPHRQGASSPSGGARGATDAADLEGDDSRDDPSASRTRPGDGPVRDANYYPSAKRTTTRPPAGLTRPPAGPDTSLNTKKTSEKTKRARVKTSSFDPTAIELPDWMPVDTWSMWARYRAETKKPITADGARLQLGKLAKLRDEGHDPVNVIEAAIENRWQGLYVPKDGSTLRRRSKPAPVDPDGYVWWQVAGFDHPGEAQNARCHIGNHLEFREGKRIGQGALA